MGLNFHRLPQSIIQLDLQLLSPQKVSSEAGTLSVVAQVPDQRAPSLGTADGQVLAALATVCVRGDVPLNILDLHGSAQGVSWPVGLLPSLVTSVVWRDTGATSPGHSSQHCSQLILLFVNAT